MQRPCVSLSPAAGAGGGIGGLAVVLLPCSLCVAHHREHHAIQDSTYFFYFVEAQKTPCPCSREQHVMFMKALAL
uniref:Uncharacterized protein n=1 Tax=Arundo donax TaxID=35708 RepID=A0A0A9H0E7_ARUDO